MPRVVGIDHLVLTVGDFKRSKAFYGKLLGFLGFKLKHSYPDMAGWSNGKTLLWIAAADAQGRKRKYRKGDIGFHHYAFELASRGDVDKLGAFLEENGMTVLDPPGEYYGRNYYAVYFADPDGMKLEGMIWAPPAAKRKPAASGKGILIARPRMSRARHFSLGCAQRSRGVGRVGAFIIMPRSSPSERARHPCCGRAASPRRARDPPPRPDRRPLGRAPARSIRRRR